jgi:hypothetical protein
VEIKYGIFTSNCSLLISLFSKMVHLRAVLLSILALFVCSSIAKKLKIRLVNGKHNYEGRIEVYHNDKWGEVCDHKWDLKGARVACRMLGYPGAIRYTAG